MSIELDDVREAADEAAKHTAQALGLYQLAATYVALALLQLSDADYVLGLGQQLPIVSSTVPTENFLTIAPALLMVLHVALLMHWRTLKKKLERVVSCCITSGGDLQAVADLLHPFALTRSILPVGGDKLMSWTAKALTFIGMVAIPLAVLLAIQVRSLAFHNEDLTLWQRGIVLVDLAALWLFIPRQNGKGGLFWLITSLGATAFVIYFSVWNAVVPGAKVQEITAETSLTDWLRPRRLDLHGLTLQSKASRSIDDKLGVLPLLELKGADLRFANLSSAILNRVDLTGADLTGADLNSTQFIRSKFGTMDDPADKSKIKRKLRTSFAYAKGGFSDFRGQNLRDVDFTGAVLVGAKLDAANLHDARLNAASLDFADLRAADLTGANLRIASLLGADLRYAVLSQADLSGADLRGVVLLHNAKSLTRMHLADLTFARTARLDDEGQAELKEALERSTEDKKEAARLWTDLQQLDQLSSRSPFYGLLANSAMWMRYDYLPFPNEKVPPPPRATYVNLLKALISSELENQPALLAAISRRQAVEMLIFKIIYSRQQMPHISKPHEVAMRVLQSRMGDPKYLVQAHTDGVKDLHDDRFSPWDDMTPPEKRPPVPKLPAWFKTLLPVLKINNGGARAELFTELKKHTQKGDELAFNSLAASVASFVERSDADSKQWILGAVAQKKLDPEVAVAVASMFEKGSETWKSILARAATQSAEIDWLIGANSGDKETLLRAASKGKVEAQGVMGAALFHDEKSSAAERQTGWSMLTDAAYRGNAHAQRALARAFADKADYKEALHWYTRAAEDGDPQALNDMAWLLATCPDKAYRDGEKAVAMASRALRESMAAPKGEAAEAHMLLDTMAAGYAASGAFVEAVSTQRRAIALLPASIGAKERSSYNERLQAFSAGRPWRKMLDAAQGQ